MTGPDHPTTGTRETDPLLQRPAPQSGRYRIIRELGRGGAAVVYLAEDTAVGQQVAYKRILGEPDAQRLERIRREVQAGRRLSHPALVRIHDLIETPEGPAIIMEAVDGPTLRQVLRERGALPFQEALAIFREILAALEALHGANLLHRDIKPENIFLPLNGGVKVGDYSICLPIERTRLTSDGSMVGTMGYMAPEQVEGRGVQPASDLYSAAVVLYEMITGHLPFQEDTPSQTLYSQLHRPPDLDVLKRAGIPGWLRSYLKRCLARRPAERFPATAAAVHALDARQGRPAPLAILRRIAWAALWVAIIGAAAWLVHWRSGPRLRSMELSGAEVTGRNGDDAVLWRRPLEKPPLAFLCEDLDGDGEPEAFAVGGGPLKSGQALSALFIESDGKIAPLTGLRGIDGTQGLGGGYRARLYAHDLDRDGCMEILGYLNSVWYPTQGFVYSVLHRQFTVHFFHPGHIAEVIFTDASGDGTEGIIFRAMNNVLGHEGVLAGLDGNTACAGRANYPAIVYMPGWRTHGNAWEGMRELYTFLPHEGYVYAARSGTFAMAGGRWSITPERTNFTGDRWGNCDQGPTRGMGSRGAEATLDYFGRIQGMLIAGTAGVRTRAAPEDWLLPVRFQGHEPWDRVFRLVRGRELIHCGATEEGLETLKALAGELPLDQEVNEAYGAQLFLATGDADRGAALALKNAARVLYRPASGRVAAAKINALAGRLTPEDLDQLEDDFKGNSGQLERARILLGMGLWTKAHRTALALSELSPAPYRFGEVCCLAVAEAATGGLSAQTLDRARAEAEEYPDLVPLRTVAQAIETARRGGPAGRAQAETLLAPIRKSAAWDLDARLCIAAFDRATRQSR